jgi:hypothetical protein
MSKARRCVVNLLWGARRSAVVARERFAGVLRVNSCVYAPLSPGLDDCVRCVGKVIPVREERACIELNVGSKYACAKIGISVG